MPLPPTPNRSESPFRESARVLGLYLRAQLIIAAILTGLYAAGFGLAGVPWWFLIALIGGLTSLIPHVGGLIPLGLAAIADLLAGRDLTHLAITFGVWLFISILEGFVITPRLLSKPLGLRPLLVFLAVIAASFLFGPIGFVLAIPALAIVMVFWRYFQRRQAPPYRS
jgi:predicted PurR-regulated permease PerM